MKEQENINSPLVLQQILIESEALGFKMSSDLLVGSMLRTFVATKRSGKFLEIGTGTGIATSWILDGMDQESQLISIDDNEEAISIAKKFWGHDKRVSFFTEDGGAWLDRSSNQFFDLIFADAWPGKYTHLDETLRLLKVGGMYVIDDMLPQSNWPEGHEAKATRLISILENRPDLLLTKMEWSTGVIVAVKIED